MKPCGDGDFCLCAFCATPHTYTQVETRDNHPRPDSPPSISSHREGQQETRRRTKRKENKKNITKKNRGKKKKTTSCWTSFFLSSTCAAMELFFFLSSRTGSNAFIDNSVFPYIKLSQRSCFLMFFFFNSFCLLVFFLWDFQSPFLPFPFCLLFVSLSLPSADKSTPLALIDFSYRLHTPSGNDCTAARPLE